MCEVGSPVKLRKSTYLTWLVGAEGLTLHTAVQLHNPGDFTGSAGVYRQVKYFYNHLVLFQVLHTVTRMQFMFETVQIGKKNQNNQNTNKKQSINHVVPYLSKIRCPSG